MEPEEPQEAGAAKQPELEAYVSTPESRAAESECLRRFYETTTFDKPIPRSEYMGAGVAVPDDYVPEEAPGD